MIYQQGSTRKFRRRAKYSDRGIIEGYSKCSTCTVGYSNYNCNSEKSSLLSDLG